MTNPLTMKLEQFTSFTDEDRMLLDDLAAQDQKSWAAKQDIVGDGDDVEHVHLVLSGMAMRNKLMLDASGRSWHSLFRATCVTSVRSCCPGWTTPSRRLRLRPVP